MIYSIIFTFQSTILGGGHLILTLSFYKLKIHFTSFYENQLPLISDPVTISFQIKNSKVLKVLTCL